MRVGGQDHEIGRLLPFLSARVDEGHAGRALAGAVEIDLRHFGIVARVEIRFADQHRQDRRLRAGFRVVAAAEPFAKAAIGAGAKPQSERIGVGLRHVAGRLRERLVAELARRLAPQRVAEALLLRRSWIWPRARAFERIAARLDLAFQVAGRAGRAAQILERRRSAARARRR